MENRILAALVKSREAYDKVADYLEPESFSPAGSTLLRFIKTYYDNDGEAEHCDIDVLRHAVENQAAAGAMRDQLQDVITSLEDDDSSTCNVVQNVLDKRRKDLGMELAQSILTGRSASEVQQHLEEYSTLVDKVSLDTSVDEEIYSPNIEELVTKRFSADNVIGLAPKSLNDKLDNNVTPGTHIILAARPEAGKTATAVNMMCGAAHQGHKVLYYANEEPLVNTILRCVSNFSGMTVKEIKEQPEKAQQIADDRGLQNITFVYASANTPAEIRALAKKHEPKLLIVDQLRGLNMAVDGLTELLERGSKAMRDIAAQQHCVVVSITQAGESAQGKAILTMSDIDSSKTGIQGACDVLILMGNNLELSNTGRRCFNLCKNKLSGDHSSWYVNLNEQLSRITD